MSSCTNRTAGFNNLFALLCSQPCVKQNRARDFLLFKYFLNNLLLTAFMQNTLSKFLELLQEKMNDSFFRKNTGTFLFSILLEMRVQSLKLIIQYWSSRSIDHSKTFLQRNSSNRIIKFPLNTCSSQITICQISFEI